MNARSMLRARPLPEYGANVFALTEPAEDVCGEVWPIGTVFEHIASATAFGTDYESVHIQGRRVTFLRTERT